MRRERIFALISTFCFQICFGLHQDYCSGQCVFDEFDDDVSFIQSHSAFNTKYLVLGGETGHHATATSDTNTSVRMDLAMKTLSFFAEVKTTIEYELRPTEIPSKSKLTLVCFELLGFGIFGIDRCYMGQPCLGVIKALTLGGLGLWTIADYLAVVIDCLLQYKALHWMSYNAVFTPASISVAYWIVLIALILVSIPFVIGSMIDLLANLSCNAELSTETEEGYEWWEKKVVSEKDRMKLNGETAAQMNYAKAVKAAGGVSLNEKDGYDTSKDQDWNPQSKPNTDMYVLITSVMWMGPKLLVFMPLMLLLNFTPCLLCRFYISLMPEPLDRVPRNCVFYLWFIVVLVASFPAILWILVNYILDTVAYYFFSILFCTIMCKWSQAISGFQKIRPFRQGPSIFYHTPDIMACVMGQSIRQGTLEMFWMISMMWILMPWLKYYICCNPFIYNLDHRLVQQISTRMDDLPGTVDDVAAACRKIISRSRQAANKRHRIDLWSFVPHYPYPPPGRRHAFGMQAGGAAYPSKFTLLVNVTHADIKTLRSREQLVLSNSIARPVYRVMLWYSNPFHFLTGWVEASISSGFPSQPDKKHGGEHPMWLVSGDSELTSSRDSFTGSGLIDRFFDYWLPVFVHEVRYSMMRAHYVHVDKMSKKNARDKALEYADSRYQQVISQDGISPAHRLIGREFYEEEDTLSIYQKGHSDSGKFQDIVGGLHDACCLRGGTCEGLLLQDDGDTEGNPGAIPKETEESMVRFPKKRPG